MRTDNSFKNILAGTAGEMLSQLMRFITRTIFIKYLSAEYLGINGLFADILTMLSIAELGIGTAILYTMYKPLAENNYPRIRSLVKYYKKAYTTIGTVIFLGCMCLMPFLKYISSTPINVPHLNLIYVLYVTKSVISYFYAHNRSLLIADQKGYIASLITSSFWIVSSGIQIVFLSIYKSFIIFLCVQIVMAFLESIFIHYFCRKKYPYLRDEGLSPLDADEKKSMFKNVYSMALYKLSYVVNNGTDNMVISKFLGIVTVGIYSNYVLIISSLQTLVSIVFRSFTSSIGNLSVTESENKMYTTFKTINLLNYFVSSTCTVCLWILINPFINLWINKPGYLLNKYDCLAIIMNFFFMGMQYTCIIYREATGTFAMGKYRPVIASAINIIASIILVRYFGIAGVLYGTVISRLCTYFWVDPWILFSKKFHKPVSEYFITFGFRTLMTVALTVALHYISAYITYGNALVQFFLKGLTGVFLSTLLFYIVHRKTAEFRQLIETLTDLLKRFMKKHRNQH